MMKTYALVLLPLAIQADDIIHYREIGGGHGRWNETIQMPLFNPYLGTLTAATLTIRVTYGGTMRFENLSSVNWLVPINAHNQMRLESPITTVTQYVFPWQFNKQTGPHDGVIDYRGGSGFTIPRDCGATYSQTLPIAGLTGVGYIPFKASGGDWMDYGLQQSFTAWMTTYSYFELWMTYRFIPSAEWQN